MGYRKITEEFSVPSDHLESLPGFAAIRIEISLVFMTSGPGAFCVADPPSESNPEPSRDNVYGWDGGSDLYGRLAVICMGALQ